ncbi:18809_t:CDS:1, partial [Gigaspora margarita]
KNRILSKKTINKSTNRSEHKENFKDEALQQLYQLRPDLNGQSVWFFPTLKKSAEGRILYEKSERRVYVYDMITQKRYATFFAWIKALSNKRFFKGKKSALSTIFLNPSYNRISVDQIIKGKNHAPYFKNSEIITLISIKDTLVKIICNNAEFANITLVESEEFLWLIFSNEKNIQKELHIKQAPHGCQEPIGCFIFVNGFEVKDHILKNNSISTRISKMDDIVSIMRFCKKLSICVGQYTK